MKFTVKDLENIEVALRLRVEAAEENNETKATAKWRKTHTKALKALLAAYATP